MKKILRIAVIAFHVLLFCSCEKKQCWECTTESSITVAAHEKTEISKEMYCDYTAEEIARVESDKTFSTTGTYGNITVINNTKTTCNHE